MGMSFEDLDAWQQARALVNSIYSLTRSDLIGRDYRLVDQLRGSGISVMNNIAEGFERTHQNEKLQFYRTARASAGEVRSLTYVIEDNYSDETESAQKLRDQSVRCGQLISGLIRSIS